MCLAQGSMKGTTRHCYILNIKAMGFRIPELKIFKVFPIISLWTLLIPHQASLNPSGLIGRIYVADHKTLLHTKYISYGPHGFREEDFKSLNPRDF